MKLVITGFLFVLSITALRAQNAAMSPGTPAAPLGGYLVVFPQAPLVTTRFDGNSEDIAKILSPHPSTSFNHDGSAFKAYVRSTTSESYNSDVADYAQRDKEIAEYQKNVQSGKWTRFLNGE
jgi:hypothetical protein